MSPFEIEAQVTLYSTDKGRLSFISSGYRPRISFSDNLQFSTDAILITPENKKLNPGETRVVTLTLFIWEHLIELLEPKQKFFLLEGHKKIGEGFITFIIGES